jgi:predicted RNA-binding protein YlqC (UPF0109 family)
MTDKVDVLAVLDFEIAEQRSEHGIADSRLLRARAAVAELIEACDERGEAEAAYDAAAALYVEDSNKGPMIGVRGRMINATKRYVAALAAVSP